MHFARLPKRALLFLVGIWLEMEYLRLVIGEPYLSMLVPAFKRRLRWVWLKVESWWADQLQKECICDPMCWEHELPLS